MAREQITTGKYLFMSVSVATLNLPVGIKLTPINESPPFFLYHAGFFPGAVQADMPGHATGQDLFKPHCGRCGA
jgi:hypothetical protein